MACHLIWNCLPVYISIYSRCSCVFFILVYWNNAFIFRFARVNHHKIWMCNSVILTTFQWYVHGKSASPHIWEPISQRIWLPQQWHWYLWWWTQENLHQEIKVYASLKNVVTISCSYYSTRQEWTDLGFEKTNGGNTNYRQREELEDQIIYGNCWHDKGCNNLGILYILFVSFRRRRHIQIFFKNHYTEQNMMFATSIERFLVWLE